MPELECLAGLLRDRDLVDRKIATLIDRPAQRGHIGEFIAARVFDIELEESAAAKGIDGYFRSGALAGKSVNVKFYGKREGLLDIRVDAVPDYFLVMAGPRTSAASSRGTHRPLVIEGVYVFDGPALVARLVERGVKIGIATSVRKHEWEAAEVYPRPGEAVAISDEQRRLLGLFST